MFKSELILLIFISFSISCNSSKNQTNNMTTNHSKYLIEKTLFWNQYIDIIKTTEEEAQKALLQYERKQLTQDGTLNFLADENLDKHRQLTDYLKDSLGIINDFKLNDSPYILADFKMPNTLTINQTEKIVEITGKQIYKLHKIKESEYGKYCIILGENYGFEDLQSTRIYQTLDEAKRDLTKQLVIQIAHYRPKFVDIDETHSKTAKFIEFKNEFEYFYFYDGYLIFQPLKETMTNLETMNSTELINIQKEIDKIIQYSKKEDVYRIEEI